MLSILRPLAPNFPRCLAMLVTLAVAASSARAQWATLDDFKAAPGKTVEVFDTKIFRASNRIIIPTLYLRVVTQGSVFASKSSGSSTASAKGKFTVQGHDRVALMALAKQLHDDFVARLRGAGWEVLTFDDIKAEAGVAAMERYTGEGALNFPTQKDGPYTYAIVAPTEAQNFKPVMQGPTWAFRFIAKSMNGTIVVPQLDIVAPQVWTETAKGYKRATAEVKALPGMHLNYAMVLALNPRGGGGVTAKLKGAIINTTTDAGSFVSASDESPTGANALSKGLSKLGGGGAINRASGSYVFQIDQAKFDAGVHAGADPFINYVAKVISAERK